MNQRNPIWADRLPEPLRFVVFGLAMLSAVAVMGAALFAAQYLIERPALDHLYGPGSYAAGLHIVNRHGRLSDGRELSTAWNWGLRLGSFLLVLPVLWGYAALLKSLGLWRPSWDK